MGGIFICEYWKLNSFVNGLIDSIVGLTGTLTLTFFSVLSVTLDLLQQASLSGVSDNIVSIPLAIFCAEFEFVSAGNACWYVE